MIVGLITGGFDPLHSGHVAYVRSAATQCEILVVGVNSDEWLQRKKGRSFMPITERLEIMKALRSVDHVITFDDSDGTARDAIRKVKQMFPGETIRFMNGGDRVFGTVPETTEKDVEFLFGVGGENKANSSSWILQEWKTPKTLRPWGYYRVLHNEGTRVKVKELVVEPGQSLSRQRHQHRSEFWIVSKGTAAVGLGNAEEVVVHLAEHEEIHIEQMQWHRLFNDSKESVHVVEIQYGNLCDENDIERRE